MYCTVADMVRRFGQTEMIQVSDRAGASTIDEDVVNEAIGDATALIDSYLEKRYRDQMPFAEPPAVLERLCCTITRRNLYTNTAPDEVVKPYDDAVRLLEHVASGKVSLGAGEQPPTSGGLPQMSSGGLTFGREAAKDFI